MQPLSWKELYGKDSRPPMSALDSFWSPQVRQLFTDLSNELARKYGLSLTHINYSASYGWKFKFTKLNIPLIKNVIILNDGFMIDHIVVKNSGDLKTALEYVKSLYSDDYLNEFEEKRKKRNEAQVERAKRRRELKNIEYQNYIQQYGKQRLNKFKWAPKVEINDLRRLYQSDAEGRLDEELLDDIGYTMYVRCLQGRDERLLANDGKIKCHGCGAILSAKSRDGLILCDCGCAYVFSDYMISFNMDGMPSRSATPFFNKFIEYWPLARTSAEKMRIIDWVIHECHRNMYSGVKRRLAGCNLINGSEEQISKLILQLANENTDK